MSVQAWMRCVQRATAAAARIARPVARTGSRVNFGKAGVRFLRCRRIVARRAAMRQLRRCGLRDETLFFGRPSIRRHDGVCVHGWFGDPAVPPRRGLETRSMAVLA